MQSIIFPCLVSTIGAWFSRRRRGVATGSWATCTNFGNIMGLQQSAWLLQYANNQWSILMFVVAIYFIIDTMLLYFLFSPDPSELELIIDVEGEIDYIKSRKENESNAAFSEVEMTDKSVESGENSRRMI